MKVVMIFDQIQAGLGGKEKANLPLGGKKGPIGSVPMLEPYLRELDGEVVACLYCGDEYFKNNKEVVTKKITAMVKKIDPDIVICGPAFNYAGYAEMCTVLAHTINQKTDIPVIVAMSKENQQTILDYKNLVDIVIMPKKGGTGLNQALKNICSLARKKVDGKATKEYKKKICY